MMKRTLAFLLTLLMLLSPLSSTLAEPRYPARQGSVTDAAAVLSPGIVADLNKAAEKLEKATGAQLLIVTVDFLDGSAVQTYGEGLRSRWNLNDNDALLLLAVGEDLFGFYGGNDFNRKLPVSTQQKLLSAHLQVPFLAQDYDAALRAFVPALATECAKVWDKKIDLGGLLGAPRTTPEPFDAEAWLKRQVEQKTETESVRRVTDEDEDTGLSLGKLILTLFLLSVIFGKKKKRRYGCGCMPFSSLLAALGLWKLWDKN